MLAAVSNQVLQAPAGAEELQAFRNPATSAALHALCLTVGWYAGTVTLVNAVQVPASPVLVLLSPVGVMPLSVLPVPVSEVPPSSDAMPESTTELSPPPEVPLSTVVAGLLELLEQPAVRARMEALMRRRRVMVGARTALLRTSPGELLNAKAQSGDARTTRAYDALPVRHGGKSSGATD
jgi:hypothetical protein